MAKLPNGDKPCPKTSLRTSIDTLKATLILPASTKLRKLSSDTAPLLTTIHASWKQFITPNNLLPHTTNSYANLMKSTILNAPTNKRPATHIPDTLPTPDTANPAPLHIMEVKDHKTLLHKTIYYVNQVKKDDLTAKHLCQHIHNGFTPKHLSRVCPEDEDTSILAIPFEVTWQAT